MRKFLFLFIVLSSISVYPQKLLSLNEAINIALQRNSDLKKSINNLKTFESGLLASYGSLLPSLGARGDFSWERSELEGGTRFVEGIPFPYPSSTTEERRYTAFIGTDWTLFDGLSNYATVSQSQSDLKSAELTLERLKQSVVFQTISFYYDVINAQQLLKVREDDVTQQQKNLETVTERNKLGAVTLADVYAQQVAFGNAELERIRAGNTLSTTKSNLLYYLGLDVFEDYTFPEDLSSEEKGELESNLSKDYEEISALVDKALNNRLDYQSAKLSLESASNGITIARGGHFPRLTNSLGFGSSANRLNDLFKSKTYSVGLTLSVPIFSGFSVDNRVQFAQVASMNREVEVNDLEREIKRNIQTTYLDLQAADKSLNVSENNVKAAEENLRIEQEKYALGSSKLLDVLIATTSYTTARTNFINAQFAYIVLSEQLKYYLGVLDYSQYK
jgi:outer membrane protein